jgi:hypothetical protein
VLPELATARICDAVLTGIAESGVQQSLSAPLSQVSAPSPVRVLSLRLDPPQYGSVTVRLKLRGNSLSLQFRTERVLTAQALGNAKERLSAALRQSGYDIDIGVLYIRSEPGTAPVAAAPPQGPADPATGNANPGLAQRDRRSPKPMPSIAGRPSYPNENPGSDDSNAPRRGAGTLYV